MLKFNNFSKNFVVIKQYMLPLSRKPEILRLHQLQNNERSRFISQFSSLMQDYLPQKLWNLASILGDAYFSYILICKCRRRLGEQYTYVAMYKQKHFEEEGVLMNEKYRTLMFILELVQRHALKKIISYCVKFIQSSTKLSSKTLLKKLLQQFSMVGIDGLFQEVHRFILMLFMLGKAHSSSLVDNILGTRYIYTYKNEKQTIIDYKIEGYLLFSVFLVKFVRLIYRFFTAQRASKKSEEAMREEDPQEQLPPTEEELCRICYDRMVNKSATFCGHIFCWDCIVKCLQISNQCPICKNKCSPREVVELVNY